MNPIEHMRQTRNEKKQNDAWLMTLADLLSLILTFFVLLYSMSSVYSVPWQAITKSLSQRLNPDRVVEYTRPAAELSIERIDIVQAHDLVYLHGIIAEKVKSSGILPSEVNVTLKDDSIIITLPSDITFVPGKAELTESAKPVLIFLGDILGPIGNMIEVIGYTDPNPINNEEFPSNWELSLSRALVVSNKLSELGYSYKIASFGRASSTYESLSSEISEKDRYAFLRRVDIVVRTERAG